MARDLADATPLAELRPTRCVGVSLPEARRVARRFLWHGLHLDLRAVENEANGLAHFYFPVWNHPVLTLT